MRGGGEDKKEKKKNYHLSNGIKISIGKRNVFVREKNMLLIKPWCESQTPENLLFLNITRGE